MTMKTWLNIGSGPRGSGLRPPGIDPALWREVCLDVDPRVAPDIVAPGHHVEAQMRALAARHFVRPAV